MHALVLRKILFLGCRNRSRSRETSVLPPRPKSHDYGYIPLFRLDKPLVPNVRNDLQRSVEIYGMPRACPVDCYACC